MADEPTNPQQIIDDATNALEQAVVKPPKKKGGKGMLIGMLLFLILTLPVAIYYGSQQITDIRSRAAVTWDYACMMSNLCAAEGTKVTIGCVPSCTSPKVCCKLEGSAPIITPTPPSGSCTPNDKKACTTDKQCPGEYVCSNSGTWSTTCYDIIDFCPAQPTAGPPPTGAKMFYCKTDTHNCIQTTDSYTNTSSCATNVYLYGQKPNSGTCYTSLSSCNSACSGSVAATPTQPTTRTPDGTWHNCSYLNNTGSTGPVASGCDSSNCGGKPCGQFTFKCGVYCLAASCGAAACYDDPSQTTPCNQCSANFGCQRAIWTNKGTSCNPVDPVGGWTAISRPVDCSCPRISQAVIDANPGNANNTSCDSPQCTSTGNFYYVCNTSTYQCTQTSSRYTSITACEAGND